MNKHEPISKIQLPHIIITILSMIIVAICLFVYMIYFYSDHRLNTLLIKNIVANNNTMSKLIIACKPNIDHENSHYNNAIHYAVRDNNIEIVRMLIYEDADIDRLNGQGLSPLMLAAAGGYKDMVLMLVESGADIEKRNYTGNTSLSYAVHWGNLNCIQLLDKYHASFNNIDKMGNNLMMSLSKDSYSPDILKYLLNKGVSPYRKNDDGISFIEYSKTELKENDYVNAKLIIEKFYCRKSGEL